MSAHLAIRILNHPSNHILTGGTLMRLIVFALLIASTTSLSGIVGKQITYKGNGITMKGYLAYDDQIKTARPGVLVVHEWWGHNDYTRKRARMLAELGYVALAVDMYGNGRRAAHPKDASKFSSEVMQNMEGMKARFLAAMNILKNNKNVDSTQIAAIGYCFGGGVVLAMAREGTPLKAVTSFHGMLATQHPAEPGKVQAKVLVCNGADDSFVSQEDISNFKQEMETANVDYKFVNYPGAVHGFTNPGATDMGKKFNISIAYNEKADKESWEDMKKLFSNTLTKR